MNLPHVHLLLNHFPIIGTLIALGLYLFALIGRSEDLKRASLVIFAGIALLSIPTYMSGNGAEEALRKLPAVSKNAIAAFARRDQMTSLTAACAEFARASAA